MRLKLNKFQADPDSTSGQGKSSGTARPYGGMRTRQRKASTVAGRATGRQGRRTRALTVRGVLHVCLYFNIILI